MDSLPAQDRAVAGGSREPVSGAGLRRTESHFEGHGQIPLFCRTWRPDSPVRALALVHGFGEHSGRYEPAAAWFAARGTVVHGFDLRGHGRSAGRRGHVGGFSDYLNDLEIFLDRVIAESNSLPVTLLGHSMGGLITTAFAVERSPRVQSLITSGSALAVSPELNGFKIRLARVLRKIAPRLAMSAGLDPNAISSEQHEVQRYLADPLVHDVSTASHAGALFDQIDRLRGAGSQVEVPMFLLHGALDSLCPPAGSTAFYQSLAGAREGSTAPRAELRIYQQSIHEILNDVERQTVMADMLDWIVRCEKDATRPGHQETQNG